LPFQAIYFLIKKFILDYLSVLNVMPVCFLSISQAATIILLFTVLILFLLSFIISGSEVAFFSLSNKDINILKRRKIPSFRRVVLLLENSKTLSATMLIANSFVNIGIIIISNLLLDDWILTFQLSWIIGFLLKLSLISFSLLLFAVILPKIWATHHKLWFAASFSLFVEVLDRLFYRLSKKFILYSDNIENKISPEKKKGRNQSNLDNAIDLMPENEASIEEKQILKGIRKFGDTAVKQVMRTRLDVSGIESKLTLSEIVKLSEDLHYSRLPVYKGNLDEIIGVLHIKDLLPFLDEEINFDWHPLIRNPFFVHEQKLIEDLLQEFRTKRTHFAIVVDEFGGTSGIITLEDILEEVIGEIKDEFDDEESINKKIDDFTFILEGKTMINDVCKMLKLAEDTFDDIRGESGSLAGLILEIAGEFPKIDEPLVFNSFTFYALEINKNRIDKVKIIIQNLQPAQ
jgi:gliding motility-associated protein GldE